MWIRKMIVNFVTGKKPKGKIGYDPSKPPKRFRILYKNSVMSFVSYSDMADWWYRHGLYLTHNLVEIDKTNYIRTYGEVRTLSEEEMDRVRNNWQEIKRSGIYEYR